MELVYSSTKPVNTPVMIELPSNGLRLRFDGPDQRLRLIEVIDFTKIRLTYKNQEIVKNIENASPFRKPGISDVGPTFRHIYHKLFGLTYAGEYLPPQDLSKPSDGTYVLSYPGIAFSFPLNASAWDPSKDHVALLSSPAAGLATSMAVFEGPSWPEARAGLFAKSLPKPHSLATANKSRDATTDEVDSAKVHENGRVELIRRSGTSFWIVFGETAVQDLVTELGPPNAIHSKNDRKLSIHQNRPVGTTGVVVPGLPYTPDDSTDTENSSSVTGTDESDEDEEQTQALNGPSTEFFYNYFNHGFDILISSSSSQSQQRPAYVDERYLSQVERTAMHTSDKLTVMKILLHGNVPGSYPFNRHRRIRWVFEHIAPTSDGTLLNSEMNFVTLSRHLRGVLRKTYSNAEEEKADQRNMVLNRGWGDSPGSSCEFLGDWESSVSSKKDELVKGEASHGEENLGNTELFGFPSMVFEVLKNGTVCCLTLF